MAAIQRMPRGYEGQPPSRGLDNHFGKLIDVGDEEALRIKSTKRTLSALARFSTVARAGPVGHFQ